MKNRILCMLLCFLSVSIISCGKSSVEKDEAKKILTEAMNTTLPTMQFCSPILLGMPNYNYPYFLKMSNAQKAGFWILEAKKIKELYYSDPTPAYVITELNRRNIQWFIVKENIREDVVFDKTPSMVLTLALGSNQVEIIFVSELKTDASGNKVCDVDFKYALKPNKFAEAFGTPVEWQNKSARLVKGNTAWKLQNFQ